MPITRRAAVLAATLTPFVTDRVPTVHPSMSVMNRSMHPSVSDGSEARSWLDAIVGKGGIHGASLFVSSPSHNLRWESAAGVLEPGGAPMQAGSPTRIASNTKTYTAASALRLVEEGQLDLDASLRGLVSPESLGLLTAGGYAPDRMTPWMLLTHMSGLWDYAQSDPYLEQVLGDPTHRWTREEQLHFAMAHGMPEGAPGQRPVYSDTGYILIGEILERESGLPLGEAYRALLGFEALGLRSPWLETIGPVPTGSLPMAHRYLGETDALSIDASSDLFGGGGLVASVVELGGVYEALFCGRVFTTRLALATMLTTVGLIGRSDVGMGIFRQQVAGYDLWQHTGFWGSAALVVPEHDLTIAFLTNQAQPGEDSDLEAFVSGILALAIEAVGGAR